MEFEDIVGAHLMPLARLSCIAEHVSGTANSAYILYIETPDIRSLASLAGERACTAEYETNASSICFPLTDEEGAGVEKELAV